MFKTAVEVHSRDQICFFYTVMRRQTVAPACDNGSCTTEHYLYGFFLFQFHQTLKTFLNDRVWDFHFYVSKNWPEQPVCLHFPGMTSSVSNLVLRKYVPHGPRLARHTMLNQSTRMEKLFNVYSDSSHQCYQFSVNKN